MRKRHIHRKKYSPNAFHCRLTEQPRPFNVVLPGTTTCLHKHCLDTKKAPHRKKCIEYPRSSGPKQSLLRYFASSGRINSAQFCFKQKKYWTKRLNSASHDSTLNLKLEIRRIGRRPDFDFGRKPEGPKKSETVFFGGESHKGKKNCRRANNNSSSNKSTS